VKPTWWRGRFGVLGEAPAPVVQAVQGFLGPQLVTEGWLAGRPVMPAEEAAACYARAVRTWGRANIHSDLDVEHFNRLAQQLIDAADADALLCSPAGGRNQAPATTRSVRPCSAYTSCGNTAAPAIWRRCACAGRPPERRWSSTSASSRRPATAGKGPIPSPRH
jgi:hypothetical protein